VVIWGDGYIDDAGKPFLKSRTVKASLLGGGLTLSALAEMHPR
jgi:hypothetical protein